MSQRITLKQLAESLDISIATASRALSDAPEIALKTRQRVQSKAREVGYVPNAAGRMLVSGRSGFVGLVLPVRGPTLVDAFLDEFFYGLSEGLNRYGSNLLLATAVAPQSELEVLRQIVRSGRADGIVLNRVAEQDERVDFLRDSGIPFVLHGRTLENHRALNWLDADGAAAFEEAFSQLYQLGHRRFGLITINEPMTFKQHRETGLKSAMDNARVGSPDLSLLKVSVDRFDKAGIQEAVQALLTRPDRPTAILGLFDDLALAVLEGAKSLDIRVPDELSVIGFDNIPAGAYVHPGLTTFAQDIRQTAIELADMLMKIIDKQPAIGIQKLLKPTLIPRGSHGPAPEKASNSTTS